MRILAVVPSQKGHAPGQRGSIELWEKVLERDGIELVYAPFETEKLRRILYHPGNNLRKATETVKCFAKRVRLLGNIEEFDAVFVYREAALLGPAILEKLIAKKRPVIYQLDDPLYIPYKSVHNGYLSYLKFFKKVEEIIKLSSVVIVNSSKINQFASKFNNNVWQIPSLVDETLFDYRGPVDLNNSPCVGWSGSPSTLSNLSMIEGPLQRISRKCQLHFIGGTRFNLEDVRFTSQAWSASTEVDDLRKMNIGLIPLPDDNPWNKDKFIMKSAQYMTLGIVPIGTPIASNREYIRHGVNGFLAETEDDWYESMKNLVDDENLRHKMSQQAAEDGKRLFTLGANAEKIVSAFRSVSGSWSSGPGIAP